MIQSKTIQHSAIFGTPTSFASLFGNTEPFTKLRIFSSVNELFIGDANIDNSPVNGFRVAPSIDNSFEFSADDDAINKLFIVSDSNNSNLIYLLVS